MFLSFLFCFSFILFLLLFGAGFHESHASLGVTLNFFPACLYLLCAGTTGLCQHTRTNRGMFKDCNNVSRGSRGEGWLGEEMPNTHA